MSFNPNEHEKTVKIPIQVRGGQIQFYFDGPMPDLREGIIGDLVLPYYAVLDPKARKLFSEERKIPLFKKGTLLYVQLRPEASDAFAMHQRLYLRVNLPAKLLIRQRALRIANLRFAREGI